MANNHDAKDVSRRIKDAAHRTADNRNILMPGYSWCNRKWHHFRDLRSIADSPTNTLIDETSENLNNRAMAWIYN
jgi:hypothetical protein